MLLMIYFGFHTAHFLIECLTLYGGMGGNIQFFGSVISGPLFGGKEKSCTDSVIPHIFGDMDAGKVEIALLAAKQTGFHRNKAL